MIPTYIDLHIHTLVSDGSLSPFEVVRAAAIQGLRAIAITDHDTVDGVLKAQQEAVGLGLQVIPGIEFSAVYSCEMHILGYWLNINHPLLTGILKEIKECNSQNLIRLIMKLKRIGIQIPLHDVKTREGNIELNGVIRYMIDRKYVESRKEAFDRYLGRGKPAYVPSKKLTPEECISVIHETGGLAILAHPGRMGLDERETEQTVLYLKRAGIDGIECYHPDHSLQFKDYCLQLALKYNLAITGGSDFHGRHRPEYQLGQACGHKRIPYSVLEDLIKYRQG